MAVFSDYISSFASEPTSNIVNNVIKDRYLTSWMRADVPESLNIDVSNFVQSASNINPINSNTLLTNTGTTNDPIYGLLNNNQPTLRFRHDGVTSSYLVLNDNATLDYTDLTLFSVFELDAVTTSAQTLISKFNTGSKREFRFCINSTAAPSNAKLFFGYSVDGVAEVARVPSAFPILTTGRIYIAVARFDGGNVTIKLIDGTTPDTTLSADFTATATIFQGDAAYQLGARVSVNDPLIGNQSEAMFYTRALSDDEIDINIAWLKRWLVEKPAPVSFLADSTIVTADSTLYTADGA